MTIPLYRKARNKVQHPYWGKDILISTPRRRHHSASSATGSDRREPALSGQEVEEAELNLPVLIRFSEILHDRVNSLCSSFNEVIRQQNYEGDTRSFADQSEPATAWSRNHFHTAALDNRQIGLEAEQQARLLAVLALSRRTDAVIV